MPLRFLGFFLMSWIRVFMIRNSKFDTTVDRIRKLNGPNPTMGVFDSTGFHAGHMKNYVREAVSKKQVTSFEIKLGVVYAHALTQIK